jgi:dolichol-phosphate mannosyltransferase
LVGHAQRTGASAVFGTRLATRRPKIFDPFDVARFGLTHVFNVLYGANITDVATCYKLMRTEDAQALDLQTSGFDLDFEIPAKLIRSGRTILELPVDYFPRDRSVGKKIDWSDGVRALMALVRYRIR